MAGAVVCVENGSFARAAEFIGVAEATREETQFDVKPMFADVYQARLRCRYELGDQRFRSIVSNSDREFEARRTELALFA